MVIYRYTVYICYLFCVEIHYQRIFCKQLPLILSYSGSHEVHSPLNFNHGDVQISHAFPVHPSLQLIHVPILLSQSPRPAHGGFPGHFTHCFDFFSFANCPCGHCLQIPLFI